MIILQLNTQSLVYLHCASRSQVPSKLEGFLFLKNHPRCELVNSEQTRDSGSVLQATFYLVAGQVGRPSITQTHNCPDLVV